jgi:hypothetical protein
MTPFQGVDLFGHPALGFTQGCLMSPFQGGCRANSEPRMLSGWGETGGEIGRVRG